MAVFSQVLPRKNFWANISQKLEQQIDPQKCHSKGVTSSWKLVAHLETVCGT